MTVIKENLSLHDIQAALSELNALSLEEYGLTLEEVLLDPSPTSPMRIQRLTGILLKKPFAIKSAASPINVTSARSSWPWADEPPEVHAGTAPVELAVLNDLRMPGPWNEPKPLAEGVGGLEPIMWDQFKDDVEHERGLF